MIEYINWNGTIVQKSDFSVGPDNRSFKYGDGFFETMKVNKAVIALEQLHFERFFSSLVLLQFDTPSFYTTHFFRRQIEMLLASNDHQSLTRVRLMVYRGDGGVHGQIDNHPNFVIQSWPLNGQANTLNTEQLKIDIFRDARKTCDLYSSVKSNNYLCYLMAAFFAAKNGLHDALVLNSHDRIADSTIANVFIIQNGKIKTPPLSEGCVSGVYRKYLLQCFDKDSIPFVEEPVTIDDVMTASEVFVTNAIHGIRWIHSCGSTVYKNEMSNYLHNTCSVSRIIQK